MNPAAIGDGAAHEAPARIVLGVAGGIAAYKAVLLLRALREAGHHVTVVPTSTALKFVGLSTWEALAGHPVRHDVLDGADEVTHVRLGREAELVIVAPATADLMARVANGRADDLLTATLLTAQCPVLLAPAMHTEMWQHPATTANVALLRERGTVVLDPAVGRLTGADTGAGRLPEPTDIFDAAMTLLRGARAGRQPLDLAGRRVLISAGGTREPLDPVRFLGNRSSGRQGYALARTAATRGAAVTVVAANVDLPTPLGVEVVPVTTAQQLQAELSARASGADAIVMSAAVADFRPAHVAEAKIKKAEEDGGTGAATSTIELVRNPDILVGLVAGRADNGTEQVIVGFAAETGDASGDALTHGRRKAARKGADLLVVNDVSADRGFGSLVNEVTILRADGTVVAAASGSKDAVADAVWDAIVPLFTTR